MITKNHLKAGAAVGLAVCEIARCTGLVNAIPPLAEFWHLSYAYLPIPIALYLFGCVLPDCDIESSFVGRHLHIPIKHRTWTHSLWIPLLMVLLVVYVHPFFAWLIFGYLIHLVLDSWSKMGICWFYPYPGYREYPSGARVKRGRMHKDFSFYSTGKRSEYMLVRALIFVSFLLIVAINWPSISEFIDYIAKLSRSVSTLEPR